VLGCLVLAGQLAALEHNWAALPRVLLANLLLNAALTRPVGTTAGVLLAAALLSALSVPIPRRSPTPACGARVRAATVAVAHLALTGFSPTHRIQIKALLDHPGSTLLRIGTALGLAIATALLIRIFAFDARSLPATIIGMAGIAVILSGLYRTLQSAHGPMQAYLAALPLGRQYWAIRDTLFVMSLGIMPLSVLLLPLLTHGVLPWLTLVFLVVAYQPLLALLRLPVLFGGRQAVLTGLIMATTWSGAAMAAIR